MTLRFSTALALLFAAGPALAQANPSPCDYYIPTGEALPRQNTVRSDTYLTAEPNPTWHSRKIAFVLGDEPVTVLQECGSRLRVRTVRGEEGWLSTVMLAGELQLLDVARKRLPASDDDCRRRFLDDRLIRRCQAGLAAQRAYDTEKRTAPMLTAEEIPAYLSGHTLIMMPRIEDSQDDLKNPPTFFFAADGEVFFKFGSGFRWRGRWTVEQDALCLPGSSLSCTRFRKLPDGRTVWVTVSDGKEYFIARSGGDSAGVVAIVSESYPNPAAAPAPKGSEAFAKPSLGGF